MLGRDMKNDTSVRSLGLTRRSVLVGGVGAAAMALIPLPRVRAAEKVIEYRLAAAAGRAAIVGGAYPETSVWAYNGQVPGPEIRVRQGDRLRVVLENRLGEETTIHWHGVRVPNPMDGVPHLTQKPVAPGETFVYEFDALDAGTFWYHPHQRSLEQVDRGLAAPLIIEEPTPIRVDRDLTWVLDDWRLTRSAAITNDFGNHMDMAMAGRLGNTVTINGRVPNTSAVRAGERIRLRLINAANARIFGLDFKDLRPKVIARDGQPVEPHEPATGQVILGPAQRVDLIIDMTGRPGDRTTVLDSFYWRSRYTLVDLVYDAAPLRESPLDEPIALPANPLQDPDLDRAERHQIVFGGGMMGGGMMRGGMMGRMRERGMTDMMPPDTMDMMGDGMRGMMGRGMAGMMGMMSGHVWNINGVSVAGHLHEPFLTLKQNRSYVCAMHNDTAFHHPIHLHGHSFRVLSRNGRPTRHREWEDTVLMAPNERIEIAFVADNPGDWMIHCHILEHQEGGMMGTIRVA
jgi:FtsP/CotA-like multicopper oxidase with cupredoxin domain